MTRVLQIRRGTTAQNDNFTGLPGEITFDTEAKTLRVHDGARQGGYSLARATDSGFDISTVPASFWTQLFSEYAPNTRTVLTSDLVLFENGSAYSECIFETSATPIICTASLKCVAPSAGYAPGDTVASFGIGPRSNPSPYVFSDASGLHTRLFIGSDSFWVSHRETGVQTAINGQDWRLLFCVYC